MRPKRLVGRGSRLLPLVYVSSLMLVALTAGALALLGAGHVTDAAVRATVAADQAAIREFVSTNLTASELAGQPMTAARQEA